MKFDEMKEWSKDAEMVGEDCVYGVCEIGMVLGLYGQTSIIFKEMATGGLISVLIEKSLKKNKIIGDLEFAKREESLLARCLEREKEQGLEV